MKKIPEDPFSAFMCKSSIDYDTLLGIVDSRMKSDPVFLMVVQHKEKKILESFNLKIMGYTSFCYEDYKDLLQNENKLFNYIPYISSMAARKYATTSPNLDNEIFSVLNAMNTSNGVSHLVKSKICVRNYIDKDRIVHKNAEIIIASVIKENIKSTNLYYGSILNNENYHTLVDASNEYSKYFTRFFLYSCNDAQKDMLKAALLFSENLIKEPLKKPKAIYPIIANKLKLTENYVETLLTDTIYGLNNRQLVRWPGQQEICMMYADLPFSRDLIFSNSIN